MKSKVKLSSGDIATDLYVSIIELHLAFNKTAIKQCKKNLKFLRKEKKEYIKRMKKGN